LTAGEGDAERCGHDNFLLNGPNEAQASGEELKEPDGLLVERISPRWRRHAGLLMLLGPAITRFAPGQGFMKRPGLHERAGAS
jgi:hypothetical protein